VDSFRDANYHYIVYEYHEAVELFDLCANPAKKNELFASPDDATSQVLWSLWSKHWMIMIARTLRFLHRHDIIHGDISLENLIVLKHNFQLRLLDFGLARFVSSSRAKTEYYSSFLPDGLVLSQYYAGKKFGKLRYMSPELFSGQPCNLFSNDVYCLGVTMYGLFTGLPCYILPIQQSDVWFNIIWTGRWIPDATLFTRVEARSTYMKLSPTVLNCIDRLLKPQTCRLSLSQLLSHPCLQIYDANFKYSSTV